MRAHAIRTERIVNKRRFGTESRRQISSSSAGSECSLLATAESCRWGAAGLVRGTRRLSLDRHARERRKRRAAAMMKSSTSSKNWNKNSMDSGSFWSDVLGITSLFVCLILHPNIDHPSLMLHKRVRLGDKQQPRPRCQIICNYPGFHSFHTWSVRSLSDNSASTYRRPSITCS